MVARFPAPWERAKRAQGTTKRLRGTALSLTLRPKIEDDRPLVQQLGTAVSGFTEGVLLGKVKRLRPSPALVIATIALFVAIGGISWAAATIGTSDIKNGAVTAKKLHKNAVTNKKIKNNAVNSAKLQDGAVSRADQSGDQRTLWAAVQSNGTVADQSGGISVTALGGGGYVIAFGEDVSGRALVATGINARVIADAILCNGGTGVGTDCSPDAPNDSKHVGVNTALAATTPATLTNLPFYVAALPK